VQRADLMEAVLADVYGPAKLVADGVLPASLVTGSRSFWRSMIGMQPPGGHRLQIYAVDLGRGPDGEWRVLADHVRAPAGAGYALENRLASSRVMGPLQTRLNVQRLAPFFASFREGLRPSAAAPIRASACSRRAASIRAMPNRRISRAISASCSSRETIWRCATINCSSARSRA
jgi:uncharacterized circularly permuted ATP-grasp superfamily protein